MLQDNSGGKSKRLPSSWSFQPDLCRETPINPEYSFAENFVPSVQQRSLVRTRHTCPKGDDFEPLAECQCINGITFRLVSNRLNLRWLAIGCLVCTAIWPTRSVDAGCPFANGVALKACLVGRRGSFSQAGRLDRAPITTRLRQLG